MKDTVLRVDHLARTVGDRAIVDDVSFEVFHGELLAVAGGSGVGKSSLLRLITSSPEPATPPAGAAGSSG